MMLRTIIALSVVLAGSLAARKNDWLIVPGQRVGPITASTSRADLDTLFGKDNVRDGSPDGSEAPDAATVVFGNDTSAALAVTWDKERPSTIHICFGTQTGPCKWRTASGIRIGLPLSELQKLNGKSFQLAGYGFDGQGTVTSWRHGLLEEDPAGVRASGGATDSGGRAGRETAEQTGVGLAETVAGRQAVLIGESVAAGPRCLGLRIGTSV